LYGNAIEFNPLMRSLFEAGPVNAVVFKLALLIFYLILIPFAARKNYKLAYRGTQFVVFSKLRDRKRIPSQRYRLPPDFCRKLANGIAWLKKKRTPAEKSMGVFFYLANSGIKRLPSQRYPSSGRKAPPLATVPFATRLLSNISEGNKIILCV
jgi:hypothetical protein